MADNNYRSSASRDPYARDPYARDSSSRERGRAPTLSQNDDPLAELARLIGQQGEAQEDDRHLPAYEAPEAAYDERYAEPAAYPEEQYAEPDQSADPAYDENAENDDDRYHQPADPAPYHAPLPRRREAAYQPHVPPRLNGAHSAAAPYPVPRPLHHNDPPLAPADEQRLPSFLPQARDDRYQYEDEDQDLPDDETYAAEEDNEPAGGRGRGGLIVVAAVLGLAVLGTAGAFAYRSMFGGSMLPSLPPIIKADTGPTKIMPNGGAQANASDPAASSAGGEKLVSREEKPVDVPAPVNAAPRVVSTIPVFPAPDSQPQPPTGMPAMPAPGPVTAPPSAAPGGAAPLPSAAAVAPPAMPLPEPKKIHTVAIRPDQPSVPDMTQPLPPPRMPPAAHVASVPANPAPAPAAPRPVPAPQASGNAPLSIVPTQGEPPAPVRTRTAVAAPPTAISPAAPAQAAPVSAPGASGGYSVQVSSQRSEDEAKASFRALKAKYPAQLGNQEATFRRADLGSKGVYYRALVGPFASMEQAAGICSSLKAAGGNCIVQRN